MASADVLDLAGGEEGMTRCAEELAAIERVLDEREVCRIHDEPETAFGDAVDGAPLTAPEDVGADTAALHVEAALGCELSDAGAGAAASEAVNTAALQMASLAAPETVAPSQDVELAASRAPLLPSTDALSRALAVLDCPYTSLSPPFCPMLQIPI
jgi:hypothetical protein